MTAQASPTAATPVARRRPARWRPSSALLAIVLGFIALQVVAFAAERLSGSHRDDLNAGTAIALVAGDLALIAIVIAFARRGAERLSAATFGVRRTAFGPALGWMLVVYFGVGALETLWIAVLGHGVRHAGTSSPHVHGVAAALGLVFAIAVVAPIAEELSFRGYLFGALTRWRGPWIAAVLTGLLFGAAHFLVYPLAFLPALAVFGFGACLLFWFTGSLLPSIALHSLNNAIATAVLLGWGWQAPVAIVGAVATALALLAPFARERAPQTVQQGGTAA